MSFRPTSAAASSVPLTCLPAIVFDTETTGLDTAGDRVIEIGAVRLGQSNDDADTFSSLVRPGIPIPPTSTAIHGIGDDDVRDAPDFASAMAAFAEWVGTRVAIGFSVGFDIGILKSEHARAQIAWRAPRSVDVRHILRLVGPDLPDDSLETASAWLGLDPAGRHRAVGDARLTAGVFTGLLPRLRERGIVTLAQLERVLRGETQRLDAEATAGWHVADSRADDPSAVAEFARVDSFPFRHRVRDIMSTPAREVEAATPLRQVLAVMIREKVSSLFVADDGNGRGIVTERDALRAVEKSGGDALGAPVGNIASRPLVGVADDEFVYRAIAAMAHRGFRHLAVLGEQGKLVGALSTRDLLRERADEAVSLGESIDTATNAEDLGRVWLGLTTAVRALDHEDVDSRDIAAIVSRELAALTHRATALAEEELVLAGEGSAPSPYAVMLLGSGGRGESLLAMDQDNAIVYDGPAEHDGWFEKLAQRMSDLLNEVGVAYCQGGVMASNRAWRGNLDDWRARIGAWITHAKPEDILSSDIFYDALPVHGELAVGERLIDEARDAAADTHRFLDALTLRASDFHTPVGMFGRLKLENGRLDLKAGGIMPIFSAARVAALRHRIRARSTPERLRAAGEHGVANSVAIGNLIDAHRTLLGLILRQQLRDLDEGLALSNRVVVSELSGSARNELDWALARLPSLADVLGVPAKF